VKREKRKIWGNVKLLFCFPIGLEARIGGDFFECVYFDKNMERGKLWKVAEEALRIEGVKIAHAVTGQYDVILYVEFLNISELSEIINKNSIH